MDNIDIELRKVLDAAVQSTSHGLIECDGMTLKELFQSKLNDLNMTTTQAERLLDISHKSLLAILNNTGERIDIINVIKLAHFLGLSISDIMKLYVPKMPSEQIGEIQKAREAGYIVANFDIALLKKIGFFKSGDLIANQSLMHIKKRITSFFGIPTVYDYTENSIFPAFSRSKRDSHELIRNFWIKSAYVQFKLINNPNEYRREYLTDLIYKIKPYTRDIKGGLLAVVRALFKIGITVIYQPHIPNLQIKGATFSCNGKPCIVLSDLNNRYPTLWFVLLHELYHVLYDFKEISERCYHISEENNSDLFLVDEVSPDEFARDFLLNKERLKFVSSYINSPSIVNKCAQEWSLHPSIIYAIYMYEASQNGFTKVWSSPLAKNIPAMTDALKLFNTHPFEKESLIESVQEIKELIYNI